MPISKKIRTYFRYFITMFLQINQKKYIDNEKIAKDIVVYKYVQRIILTLM